uniref:Uncharacterized protein n=1 Tax=Acrobeloides nanus TaxID=290746 RepID=A0A914CJF4_9BILA
MESLEYRPVISYNLMHGKNKITINFLWMARSLDHSARILEQLKLPKQPPISFLRQKQDISRKRRQQWKAAMMALDTKFDPNFLIRPTDPNPDPIRHTNLYRKNNGCI